jgi:hypothetical protein
MLRHLPLSLLALLLAAVPVYGQERPVHVAPSAPLDRPVEAAMPCQWYATERAMEPYVAKARASYPAAKARFQAGLPAQHSFFVTTRLRDARGRIEQVFVAVDTIVGREIRGRIWSQIHIVDGYRMRQRYAFSEADLIDWMVARPDGTEEGNVVGVFLDTYQPPARCASTERVG